MPKVKAKSGAVYAVHKGLVPGIYLSWDAAKVQVAGVSGAVYKKFDTEEEAERFVALGREQCSAVVTLKPSNPRGRVIHVIDAPLKSGETPVAMADLQSLIKLANEDVSRPHPAGVRANADLTTLPSEVYVDGSCFDNGFKGAMAGYAVWFGDDHPLNEKGRVEGAQTNQRAELLAIWRALLIIRDSYASDIPITIRTDSMYALKCYTVYPDQWKRRNWNTVKGTPVMNTDIIAGAYALLCDMPNVKIRHVDAHRGIYGNEAADRLAKSAIVSKCL